MAGSLSAHELCRPVYCPRVVSSLSTCSVTGGQSYKWKHFSHGYCVRVCFHKNEQKIYLFFRYFLVGPTAQQTRSFDWLRDHLPTDGSVQMSDVTSMYTALDVIGPKAKELLSELTDMPLEKLSFPHMTCKVWAVWFAVDMQCKSMRGLSPFTDLFPKMLLKLFNNRNHNSNSKVSFKRIFVH